MSLPVRETGANPLHKITGSNSKICSIFEVMLSNPRGPGHVILSEAKNLVPCQKTLVKTIIGPRPSYPR